MRKQHYAFVFQKGHEPVEPNIKNIGRQHYFHANPAESDLEHQISVKESDHANLVAKLRISDISPEDKLQIDEFVIHLGLRTRNLRDGLAAVPEAMFDALEHRFSGSAEAEKRLEHMIMQELRKQLESPPLRDALMALPVEPRKLFLTALIAMTKSPEFKNGIPLALQKLRGMLDFSAIVEKTHLKALSAAQMENAIQNRQDHFAGLNWRIVQEPAGTFTLGDVGPFAKYRNLPEYGQIIRVEGILDGAVVPISSSRLLVGQRDGFFVDLTPHEANTISAELSREFYVASQNTETERAYLIPLGRRSALMTEKEFQLG